MPLHLEDDTGQTPEHACSEDAATMWDRHGVQAGLPGDEMSTTPDTTSPGRPTVARGPGTSRLAPRIALVGLGFTFAKRWG